LKQGAPSLELPRSRFSKWWRSPTSSYPYASSNTASMILAPSTGDTGEVMFKPEGPTGSQMIQQRYHSPGRGGTAGNIPTSNYTVHPYNSSTLTSTMEPSGLGLNSMYDDDESFLGFGSQTHLSPPVQTRHWMDDRSFPFLPRSPCFALEEIVSRIIDDLGALFIFQPLRFLDDIGLQKAMLEFWWQHAEKQMLIE
jgi:hypothetical protein